jgi:predicted SAM-dependent methyltransferase
MKYRVMLERRQLIRPVATRRLRQLIAHGSPPWNVQVGAGGVELPGWVNTDVRYPTDYWLDATRPWPFHEGTVTRVFSDNVIEHMSIESGRSFLRCAFVALGHGGKIRIVTPDAAGCVHAYLTKPDIHLHAMQAQGRQAEHPVDLIRSAFSLWGHHTGYVYDEHALRTELERAGFISVRRYPPGESFDPGLQHLDRQPSNADFYLAMEGTKP